MTTKQYYIFGARNAFKDLLIVKTDKFDSISHQNQNNFMLCIEHEVIFFEKAS